MKSKKLKQNALSFATVLFLLSVLLQISNIANYSWALAAQEENKESEIYSNCQISAEQFSASLDLREIEIISKEVILSEKEKAIRRLEREINDRTSELSAQEIRLKKLYTISNEASEKDLAKLVSIYEAMKAKEAANLFAQMDPKFAAGFLSRMKANEAAQILSNMSSDQAYNISAILASRNIAAESSDIEKGN